MEDSLALFYTYVSQLCFDKGQELIDKEKEITQYGPYKSFLGLLPNLMNAERFYINLGFVTTKNKIFMRKDNSVRSIYEGLRADFYRLEESCTDEEVASIALQSGRYITARIQLIDIYEKMYAMGISSKPIKYEELLALVEAVMNHSLGLTHAAVTSLKTAVSLECEILMLLLQAQIDLENWRFLLTLLNIHGANTRIAAWEKSLQNRESWKLGFGASFLKVNSFPPLVQWLIRLKVSTLNKFTLYFQHSLQLQTNSLDFRALCNKHGIDYFQRNRSRYMLLDVDIYTDYLLAAENIMLTKIKQICKSEVFWRSAPPLVYSSENLQRRYDAMTVMLIFYLDGSSDSGPSYQLPNKIETKTSDSHAIMVYSPINLIEQLPTISKAITEKSSDLAALERVVCCYSTKDQSSYFMTSIDPRVTLVFVFDSKKDEKETSLCKHIMELSVQLRSNSTFSKLKLNS